MLLSSRVIVKHFSLQQLPVPGQLVCKRYEILSLRVTQNDAKETEKETEWRQRSRVRDKMQSCKCHVQTQTPISHCYFHPPLFKRVNSMLYVRFCFLSPAVQRFTQWRRRRKITAKVTTKNEKGTCIICKYIFSFFFSFFCFAMQAKPNVVSFVIYYCESFFIHAQNCQLILRKLPYCCTLHRAFW